MKKQYITKTQFTDDYMRGAKLLEQMNDQNIEFFIGLGSSRVDTLTDRFVEKAISTGLYKNTNGELTLVEDNIPDDSTKEEEESRLQAIQEAVATYTKFGTDTGFDMVTGSIAVNLGAESFQETFDFETSFARVEKLVKELLATFDFKVMLEAGSVKIANEENYDDPEPAPVDGDDRPITIRQYKTHHANDHIGKDGIIVNKDETTGEVTLSLDPQVIGGDLQVEDTEITATEAHITETEKAYDDDILTRARVL